MSISPFHVWAIVRLLPNMQRVVVNRFRRRSDGEECLHLLRRSMPNLKYVMLYSPPGQDIGVMMDAISQDWEMFSEDGNAEVAKMMQDLRKALNHQPLPKVRALLRSKVEAISQIHPEVYDTDVRNTIEIRLTRWACTVHELPGSFALPTSYWNL